ncbi:MAG: RHS repeat protein, partial [Muribaculaceae bacterium]|nr:RHS repeat protein [Muribaculaceae bacterium]
MKKLYLTSLLCLLAASGVAAGPRFIKAKSAKARKAVIERKAPKASPVFRPLSQADFVYSDGEWMPLGNMDYTYDAAGNVLSETLDADGEYSRTVYTYDEAGRVISTEVEISEDGEEWTPDTRLLFEWDSKVPDYFISRMGYNFDGESWVSNYYCQTNDITRNDDGNITSILTSLPIYNELNPAYRYDWVYDNATGRAVEFHQWSNYGTPDNPDWEPSENMYYADIEWNTTDGQLVA